MLTMTLPHNALAFRFSIIACVAVFILTVPVPNIYHAVVILGQAHFLLAYLYQFKTGKINFSYIAKYIVVFVAIFGSYFLYGPNSLPGFLAGAYFVIHFLYDERYLMSEPTSFEGWLRLSPFIVVCFPHLLLQYGIDIYEPAKNISLFFFSAYIISRIINKKPVTEQDAYFLITFTACYFLTFSSYAPSQTQVLNFIILVHYGNWYLNYLIKFKDKPAAFKTLSIEILLCNALMLILFYYHSIEHASMLSGFKYFFSNDYFSLWTIMHYLVTFRSTDLRNWLPETFKTARPGGNV
jgi:hypothetical protein